MTDDLYRQNRARFLERLALEGAAAVIPTASLKTRNHDCQYPFRPTSDFYWCTGFREPGACLVLLPGHKAGAAGGAQDGNGAPRSILFLRERDKAKEIWDGRRLGVERAAQALGVDEARDIEKLWDELPELLSGYERIVYRFDIEPENDRRMIQTLSTLRSRARGGIAPPTEIVDHVATMHEMRLVKSEPEIERMRRAAAITAAAHTRAMAAVRPGLMEYELEALLDHQYRAHGSTGAAYGHICAGGANACILHYVENDRKLVDGDLVLVDSGCEWDFYAADITRTYPVNGRFSPEQQALYEVVLAAQEAAVAQVRPGVTFASIHDVALGELVDGLLELGLLRGSKAGVIEEGTYKEFFMHKTSHWLGLDVHDCGRYEEGGASRSLVPGMVLTIEPGLYVDPENEAVDERWRGIGIRIEDDVLVTPSGHENLTAAAPKSVAGIEAACQATEPVRAR